MKFAIKSFVIIIVAGSFAMASNLSETPYTDTGTQDFKSDDSLQLDIAYGGIMAEEFETSPPGMEPLLQFGTSTADAVGFGDFGNTLGTNDWYPTTINYTLNDRSPWYQGFMLKDITIYVYPAASARRYYDFQVQYAVAGDPNYYDALDHDTIYDHIADDTMDPNTGTKIAITDINATNVTRVRIWTHPAVVGFEKFSTTIAEVDVNITDCNAYPEQDINTDCIVDMKDLKFLADDWLKNM